MDVVVWRWGGVTAVMMAATAEVNVQVCMPLFAPLLAILTLLLSLVAFPRNLTLKTSAFTSPLMTLTPKTQRLRPSSPRTTFPAVPSARLHQVGYEIFAAATTNAARRRPSGHPWRT